MKSKLEHWLLPENLKKIKEWMTEGCTLTDLSKRMGVSRATLRSWRAKHKELDETITDGAIPADSNVENALYQRAVGMTLTERYYEERYNKETQKMVKVLVKEVVKEVAPDTKACIYWLKNRLPDKWQDRREVVIDSDDEGSTGVVILPAIKELPKPPEVVDGE